MQNEEGLRRRTPQSKKWSWTWNNYPENWQHNFLKQQNVKQISYLIAGYEIAPGTGTKHLQGFILLKKKKSMNGVKNLLGCKEIHLEISKGTILENINYCSKKNEGHENEEKEIYEYGEKPSEYCDVPGKQWEEYVECCKTHTREEMINHPKWSRTYVMNPKTYDTIRDQFKKYKTRDGERKFNEWYWGPAGTGKSRKAREENEGAYIKCCNKWWDGYDGEAVAIMEDLDPNTGKCLTHHIKVWGDRYPFRAEIKGSSFLCNPLKLIITSNYSPDQIWEGQPEDLEAIRDRFVITHFNKL